MKTKARPIPTPSETERVVIHNQLPIGHRYRADIESVSQAALRGLPGPWDVSVNAVGRSWFRIDVVAPDGASWSMSVPVDDGPTAADLAAAIRTACLRRSRLLPAPEGTPK